MNMRNKKLLERLNSSPDSISLHDATLYRFSWINNSVSLTLALGGHHYLVNNLEPFITDIHNTVVLALHFENIKSFTCDFDTDFVFEGCEIAANDVENDTFKLQLLDGISFGSLSFLYENFSWDVIGEFDDARLLDWQKANEISQ